MTYDIICGILPLYKSGIDTEIIYNAAYTVANNHIYTAKKGRPADTVDYDKVAAVTPAAPYVTTAAAEKVDKKRELLDNKILSLLTDRQKEFYRLVYIENIPKVDAAKMMNIKKQSVNDLNKALQKKIIAHQTELFSEETLKKIRLKIK